MGKYQSFMQVLSHLVFGGLSDYRGGLGSPFMFVDEVIVGGAVGVE